MSDKLNRLVSEKVMGWKWFRAVPCEWFDGQGRDCLLAHCLRQNASFLLSPEQSKTSDLMKESDGNGMTVMHPKFKPMEGVWNGWGKPKPFSTDFGAAWEVRAEMKRRGWNLHIDDYGNRVRANFSKDMLYDWRNNREHANECVAICLAALAVCGVSDDEIQEAMR